MFAFVVIVLTLKKNLGNLLVVSEGAGPAFTGKKSKAAAGRDEEHFDGIPEMDDQVIGDIKEFAADNPDRVAEVIQSWIREIDLSGATNAVGE